MDNNKICKGLWRNHELVCYCECLKDNHHSNTTTSYDPMVTCSDCIELIAIETSIVNEVLNEVL